jgi:hypothetical protein
MFPYIPIPPIEPISFWVGFLAGILLVWLFGKIKNLLSQTTTRWREQQEAAQIRRSSSLEEHHRQNTLRLAQGMHLAAPLFSLDEILIPPRLLAPPAYTVPGEPPPPEDIVTYSLPYLPAWPELASVYQAPTLSLEEALSGGVHLALAGQPGSGKTVALAHLASQIARGETVGELQRAIPILLHVADLHLTAGSQDNPLAPITNAIAEQAQLFDLPRLPAFVQYAFASGRACLLLDGLDELPQAEIVRTTEFLASLLKTYPGIRIVTTICPEYADGLLALGFKALTLLPWNQENQRHFLQRWGNVWTRFIAREAWAQSELENIDPILLNAWLESDNAFLTPLEMTLKTWSAYAGDALGSSVLDNIECHLRRLAPVDVPVAALETLAMQVVLTSQPIFDSHTAREWVRSFEPPEEKPAIPEEIPEQKDSQKGKTAPPMPPSPGLLPKMAESGLLVKHSNNRMRFCHAVIEGYLAGRALAIYEAGDRLKDQPFWSGQIQTMRFLAAQGEAGSLIEKFLAESKPPLEQHLLLAARCLRDAPRQATWRGKVMMALAVLLQTDNLPLALRAQAVAALVLSRDPGAPILFRQLLQSPSSETVRLAALGSGALQDQKAIENLRSLLGSNDFYTRRAACLALIAIGSTPALEAVAASLLNGDEDLRRAAAEALANDPQEGYAALQDGVTLSDILVRRASVYGLGRVQEAWALEILEKVQVEDDQWIVRNAATEMVEIRSRPKPYIPRPLTPPSETPWLIAFAGTQGMGISPGSPATDILQMALQSDNVDECLAALPYLVKNPTEGIIRSLYDLMYHSREAEIREAAFHTIWEIAVSGVHLPPPHVEEISK